MGLPLLVWPLIIGGIGYTASKSADAAEAGAELAKWATIAGGVYVSYRALQAAGVVK